MILRNKRHRKLILFAIVLTTMMFTASVSYAEHLIAPITIDVTPELGTNMPVHASIDLPEELRGLSYEQIEVTVHPINKPDQKTAGQVVPACENGYELWWIVEDADQAGNEWQASLSIGEFPTGQRFSWSGKPGEYLDLLYQDRPVTRYMYASDESNDQRAYETYKVYHHVFDVKGESFITKGPGGLFTHHRGIYYGFNHLHYDDDQRDDWWHMRDGVRQEHYAFEEMISGPVLARSTAVIHWNDSDGKPVVRERRTLTAYRQPLPTIALLDFKSELTAVRSDIRLSGDPEHAGVQYRAHNYVAEETTEQTVYVFKDPQANAHEDRDMPWATMKYYMQDKQPYTVQQMNHPTNPKDTLFSAYRDYGRFGAFFEADVAKDESLTVCYRFWIGNTEMPSRDLLHQRWEAFVKTNDMYD